MAARRGRLLVLVNVGYGKLNQCKDAKHARLGTK